MKASKVRQAYLIGKSSKLTQENFIYFIINMKQEWNLDEAETLSLIALLKPFIQKG